MTQSAGISEEQLRKALEDADGSPTKAAETLGIHRVTVYKLLRRYGIKVRKTVQVN